MSIAQLSKEKNPKLVIAANNRLEYEKQDKSIGKMKESTALTKVIKEAGTLAAMKHGKVLLSVEKDGEYKNYFVNKLENKTIILNRTDAPDNKEATVYVNYITKEGAKPYYTLNTQSSGGKELLDSVGVKDDKYLSTRVTLSNDEIKQQLSDKGDSFQAIISKDGFRIEEKQEMAKSNSPEYDERAIYDKSVEEYKDSKKEIDQKTFTIRQTKIIEVDKKDVQSHETTFKSQNEAEKYQYHAGNGHTLPKEVVERIKKEVTLEKKGMEKKPPFKRKAPSLEKGSQGIER